MSPSTTLLHHSPLPHPKTLPSRPPHHRDTRIAAPALTPAPTVLTESPAVTVTVQVTLPGDAGGDNAGALNAATLLAEQLHSVASSATTDAGSVADISTTVALLVDRNGAPRVTTTPRRPAFPRAVHRLAALQILTDRREAVLSGTALALTRREYDLLLFLALYPGRVFTRPQLLKSVWGHSIISGERTVDVHVRRLRSKLQHLGPTITTVRGIGYRLDDVDRVAVVNHRPAVDQHGSGVRAAAD
jgi:DNA-binding winged helix-turn-helix (wHTH) protein